VTVDCVCQQKECIVNKRSLALWGRKKNKRKVVKFWFIWKANSF
jgi:hypothetical protein